MKGKYLAISALTIALAAPAGLVTAKAYAAPSPAGFYQERPWDQVPDDFRDAQRKGFHDGVEAARRDAESRRHRDADDHETYRHPHVERSLRDDYREGFRRGYETAVRHMEEHRDRDHDHD